MRRKLASPPGNTACRASTSGPAYTFVLDQRWPRVAAAVLAGTALAVAGTTVQAVCRNPLAEPGILGITAGLVTAVIGAPYLVWLLWRCRAVANNPR